MQKSRKEPLYRKVNTKARNVRHHFGEDYKHSRNTKKNTSTKMKQGVERGLDYTPLFKFLLKQVGKNCDQVLSSIKERILDQDMPFYMISKSKDIASDYFRSGESSYFSGLYIDEKGNLQLTNKELNHTNMKPSCHCCTHTFNGKVFTQKFTME